MPNFSITSANSLAHLVVKGSANSNVFSAFSIMPAGIKFERYSTDSAWTKEMQQVIQSRKGVDGHISFGYDATVVRSISFVFEPNSPTLDALRTLIAQQNAQLDAIVCDLNIEVPSLGYSFTLENCACVNDSILGSASKVLDPVTVTFEGEELWAERIY